MRQGLLIALFCLSSIFCYSQQQDLIKLKNGKVFNKEIVNYFENMHIKK